MINTITPINLTIDAPEYVILPKKAPINIIKILTQEVHPGNKLKDAKDKYETITKTIGISAIAVETVNECTELRKENKRLKDKLETIKTKIMEMV